MHNKIITEMSICQAENGFSLDELVKKAADAYEKKAFAEKIARIILKRFTNAKAWEDYWQNKMNCAGNVVISIGNYKCFSQNLGQ